MLDRVAAVFDAFGENDDGLGVSELARRANLPKSTVSRIAAELVGQRFLDREGDKLYLGFRLFELGQTVEQPRRLRQLALPVMTELRNLTGHTVELAVLDGADVVLIAIVRGQHTPTSAGRLGGRLPAHATALGKAILAFSAQEVVDVIADGWLEPRTIREPSSLLRELTETRRSGIATEREECAVGRASVASPILGHGAVPVAAISVIAHAEEFAADRVSPVVRAAALSLSRRVCAAGRTL
ncbi:IclR family transcriptional regulator [Agromyces albus]|uniref:IclR family transcriptional regulator n=1 Tax=Agromyces albus TaxID=205332 RepID=UPI0019D6DCBF|nr:IclR family transcriptional regulator [Agromyces albus]